MSEALLVLDHVSAGYDEAVVLESISLQLAEGGRLAVLGRNGMGKTTLLTTLMGLTRLFGGSLRWQGTDLGSLPPHRRAKAGLGWVPQERAIFPALTVEENLTVAARPGYWDLARVYGFFPRIKERCRNMGGELSGGEQQMLAIARALMLNPKLLLLDEPMEGLAPIIVQELAAAIPRLATESGLSVILVEQHAEQALQLTDNAIVLERGRIVYQGPSDQLLQDKETLNSTVGVAVRA
jgi:branched-chain amino acid transport system ATP-binding protein